MDALVSVAIGIGLVLSLLFSEMVGLAAGGMVVPGYLALALRDPLKVLMTVGVALLTYGIVKVLSMFMLVYGRRRTALMILVGFLLGELARATLRFEMGMLGLQLTAIGFIIPGLIAMWMDRQGIIETLSILVVGAVGVRLILILVQAGEMF